jgi:molybdate transport system substrate-binding protein
LAGPIPAEIQLVQVFAAAIVTGSKEREAATRLTEFLASDGASAAIQKSGMEQVGKRGTN